MVYLGKKIVKLNFIGSLKFVDVIDGTIKELSEEDFEGVKEIRQYAFSHCDFLESVFLGEDITQIDSNAFSYNDSLKTISIGDNVDTIKQYAFGYSGAAERIVYIGSGIKTIERNAFHVLSSGKKIEVHISAKTPPTIQATSFPLGSTNVVSFYVPASSLEEYKAATNWATYADKIYAEEEA